MVPSFRSLALYGWALAASVGLLSPVSVVGRLLAEHTELTKLRATHREEGGDGEVGDPVERLADGHERVLGVDGHDLGDDEALDVADAHREADDDHDHREDLCNGRVTEA